MSHALSGFFMFEIVQEIIMDFMDFLPFYVLIFMICAFLGKVVRS